MKSNTRREFLKNNATLAAMLPLMGLAHGCKPAGGDKVSTVAQSMSQGFTLEEFGLQLWSVRDFMEKDPKGTLAALASYGYDTIESFQGAQGVFWGMSSGDFQRYLSDHNLKMLSTHTNPQYTLDPKREDEFKKLVEDLQGVGVQYIVNPWMAQLKTADEFKKATDGLNRCGEICKDADIMYCYHNHEYSFFEKDGEIPQRIMMDGTAGNNVGFEMDIYWVVAANEDPEAWLNEYPGRFVLSHVKDRYDKKRVLQIMEEEDAESTARTSASCVLGTGIIDFPQVLATAKKNGMKRYIVEQERYDGMTSMQAIQKDAEYMKAFQA